MERKRDRTLNIRTTGIREWSVEEVHYNRCESTPYKALDRLFERYSFNKGDELVDFGSGRGRVAFSIHNRFRIPVDGVEANDKTFDELLVNQRNYLATAKHINAPLYFEFGTAENFDIKPSHNKFYFFNPFSIKIFRIVVRKILASFKEHPREIDLILYYPILQYRQFLQKDTPFELVNDIKVPGDMEVIEKFMIYRLYPEEEA